jgi:hypothetical protein
MADFYPRLVGAARSHARRDDLWLYSELQWNNLLDAQAHAPLRALPREGIYQHTLNRSYWNLVKERLTPDYVGALPTAANVFRAQFACQWNGSRATDRCTFNGRDFAESEEIAPRLGGEGAAYQFLEVTGLLDSEDAIEQSELRQLHAEAVDASHQTDCDAGHRWLSLADRIARREMNCRHSGI